MSKNIDMTEVANRLGMKYRTPEQVDDSAGRVQNEILNAQASPGGIVVTTHDGQKYMLVDETDPQYDKRTKGALWLTPPPRVSDGKLVPYEGTFPVYRQPGVDLVSGESEADD